MALKLFNSLSQKLEVFIPINQENIGVYVCGPTVYDRPHIGNARSVVVYDILYRVLSYVYGKEKVSYIRNITDVDDKINIAAKKAKIPIRELTSTMIEYFNQDMSSLNCLKPTIEPRATDHIMEIINMIDKLIQNGSAYHANGHVYFSVASSKNYGELSGRKIEELIAGSRIEISTYKRSPEDFVLWKPASKDDDVSSIFDSPWSKGRPGWHIECSAMSTKYLGKDFDIHGGGIDLIFPHHTNEIAQSCACYKNSSYAKYWVHNGFVTVDGDKMSKSLGNFFTVQDLLKKNIRGESIRYVYLATHYRKPLNWTQKTLDDAKKSLDSFYRVLQAQSANLQNLEREQLCIDDEVKDALYDDLNTPAVLGYMHETLKAYNKATNEKKQLELSIKLYNTGVLLGLFATTPDKWFKIDSNPEVVKLIEQRSIAKKNKCWQDADEIRSKLTGMGIVLEDHPDGTTSWYKK